ncbi:hypothetical protein LIER_41458 [Lithospermum erythrorhizon]|uniref:Uncharacterized protein n=1 Tax=Lithospermum erythrorhizon TaxID=34254 RepID=A0AAV3RCN0_LITER
MEEAEKQVVEKRKKMQAEGVFKASRKGVVIHYKICGVVAHNARTCPRKPADGGSQPTQTKSKKTKTGTSSSSRPTKSTKEWEESTLVIYL